MTDIGSASIAYCLVLFLVCLLLLMLFFCEFGRNRDEMTTNSSSKASVLTIVVPTIDGYKSKLLSRREEPWPLRDISRKGKLETATGNFEPRTEELTNCSLEINDGSESEISQPDRIYARS